MKHDSGDDSTKHEGEAMHDDSMKHDEGSMKHEEG